MSYLDQFEPTTPADHYRAQWSKIIVRANDGLPPGAVVGATQTEDPGQTADSLNGYINFAKLKANLDQQDADKQQSFLMAQPAPVKAGLSGVGFIPKPTQKEINEASGAGGLAFGTVGHGLLGAVKFVGHTLGGAFKSAASLLRPVTEPFQRVASLAKDELVAAAIYFQVHHVWGFGDGDIEDWITPDGKMTAKGFRDIFTRIHYGGNIINMKDLDAKGLEPEQQHLAQQMAFGGEDPEFIKKLVEQHGIGKFYETTTDPKFQEYLQALNNRRGTFGRTLTRWAIGPAFQTITGADITPDTIRGQKAFRMFSGLTDATATILADPSTYLIGAVPNAVKSSYALTSGADVLAQASRPTVARAFRLISESVEGNTLNYAKARIVLPKVADEVLDHLALVAKEGKLATAEDAAQAFASFADDFARAEGKAAHAGQLQVPHVSWLGENLRIPVKTKAIDVVDQMRRFGGETVFGLSSDSLSSTITLPVRRVANMVWNFAHTGVSLRTEREGLDLTSADFPRTVQKLLEFTNIPRAEVQRIVDRVAQLDPTGRALEMESINNTYFRGVANLWGKELEDLPVLKEYMDDISKANRAAVDGSGISMMDAEGNPLNALGEASEVGRIRGAMTTKDLEEVPVFAIPSLKRTISAVRASNFFHTTPTIAAINDAVETFMEQVWRPFVLIRLGFPLRVGMEEAFREMLEKGYMGYVRGHLGDTMRRWTFRAETADVRLQNTLTKWGIGESTALRVARDRIAAKAWQSIGRLAEGLGESLGADAFRYYTEAANWKTHRYGRVGAPEEVSSHESMAFERAQELQAHVNSGAIAREIELDLPEIRQVVHPALDDPKAQEMDLKFLKKIATPPEDPSILEALADDIRQNGQREAGVLAVDDTNHLVMFQDGNHRVVANEMAGNTTMPVRIVRADLSGEATAVPYLNHFHLPGDGSFAPDAFFKEGVIKNKPVAAAQVKAGTHEGLSHWRKNLDRLHAPETEDAFDVLRTFDDLKSQRVPINLEEKVQKMGQNPNMRLVRTKALARIFNETPVPDLERFEGLKQIVRERGMPEPIRLYTDGEQVVMANGHKSYRAAVEAGHSYVPVEVHYGPITDEILRHNVPLGSEPNVSIHPVEALGGKGDLTFPPPKKLSAAETKAAFRFAEKPNDSNDVKALADLYNRFHLDDQTGGGLLFASREAKEAWFKGVPAEKVFPDIMAPTSIDELQFAIQKSIRQGLENPAIKDKVDRAWFSKMNTARKALDRGRALDQHAKRLSDALMSSFVAKDQPSKPLLDFIAAHGEVPDEAWIAQNIPIDQWPTQYSRPPMLPTRAKPWETFVNWAFRHEGNAIDRISRNPIHTHEMAVALKESESHFLALRESIGDEAARTWWYENADKVARKNMEGKIHDPATRSYLSQLHRTSMPFLFAQEQFVKRWAKTLVLEPTAARRAQLTMMGLRDAGLIHKNQRGEDVFVYPGSQWMIPALAGFGGLMAGTPTQFGQTVGLTSKIDYFVPGLDRGLSPDVGPFVMIPLKWATQKMPGNRDVQDVTKLVIGETGYSRAWWASLMPSAMYNVLRTNFESANAEEASSAMMSAQVNSWHILMANPKTALKEDASPEEQEEFKDRVTHMARSILFERAVLGLVTPASPSIEWTDHLPQEYRDLLRDSGDIAVAGALFHEKNPDAGWAEVFQTHPAVAGTLVTPSQRVGDWITENDRFIAKYGKAATFFLPYDPTGEFDHEAYAEEINHGLRLRREVVSKTQNQDLTGMWQTGVISQAAEFYYRQLDAYEKRLSETAGSERKDLKEAWGEYRDAYLSQHPLFSQYLSQSRARQHERGEIFKKVADALEDPFAPVTEQTKGLKEMVEGYTGLRDTLDSLGRSDADEAARADLLDAFRAWGTQYPNYVAKMFYRSIIEPELPQ